MRGTRASLLLCVILLGNKFGPTQAAIAPSTDFCDITKSCSPSSCDVNTEEDCIITVADIDILTDLSGMTCKTCTQSSASMCSASSLTSVIKPEEGIVAAYCNDEFLVIWSTGMPGYDTDEALGQVPLPPGGDNMCRVRAALTQRNVFKIPLTTTEQTESNTVPNPLPGVPGMPAAGAVGVATNGVPMFPNYNNRGLPAWISCELDFCNAHSGRGADYHYHGDPFGAEGACLYSASDFTEDHPPQIGWALDGYLIFGRHLDGTEEGASQALDACGGHSHGAYGYHYHAEVETELSTSTLDGTDGSGPFSYTAYRLAPAECWRGDVDAIANFWAGSGQQANYDRSKGSWEAGSHNDWEQLRPCCGSSEYALAEGASLDGAGACADAAEGGCGLGGLGSAQLPYEWETENQQPYMCPPSLDLSEMTFACAQSEFPAGGNEGTEAEVACPSEGQIQCFVFASIGKVGGSCGGDPFLEDPSGEWAYLPAAAGEACVGQPACTLSQTSAAINAAALSYGGDGSAPSVNKAKYVAVCSGTTAPTQTPSTGDGSGCTEQATCSGTDDQGRACPASLNQDGLCPRGCTLVPAGEGCDSGEDTDPATSTPQTTPQPPSNPSNTEASPTTATGSVSLSATATLEGMTLAEWSGAAEERFKEAAAQVVGKSAGDVTVTDKREVTSRRRRLLATSVEVDYQVAGFESEDAATAAASTLEAKTSELVAALQAHASFASLTGISNDFGDLLIPTSSPSPSQPAPAPRIAHMPVVLLGCLALAAGAVRIQ